jgi:hypothetical protein
MAKKKPEKAVPPPPRTDAPAAQAHLPLGPDWEPKPIPTPKDLVNLQEKANDKALEEVWAELRPQQQAFLAAFLETGNRAEAYRRAYNPTATDHVASVCGSRMLASVGISTIFEKLNDQKAAAMHVASQVFFDMANAVVPKLRKDRKTGQYVNIGVVPDWKTRSDGAHGLAKVYGNYAPENVRLSGTIKTQSKVLIVGLPPKDPAGAAPMPPSQVPQDARGN